MHLDRLLHGLDGAKDKYYALYALTQCLSSVAMWAEPYLCDSLLVKYADTSSSTTRSRSPSSCIWPRRPAWSRGRPRPPRLLRDA